MIRWFKAALRRAGLPEIRFHDLRHSAITLLVHDGADPKTVQTIVGHSDVRLTLNVYTQATTVAQQTAMDRTWGELVPLPGVALPMARNPSATRH